MARSGLFPQDQAAVAAAALLGSREAQRDVLEMTVALSDAGIEPIEIFKLAAMKSLRTALEKNKLPPRRWATKKGREGKQFQIAVKYWKEKLTNHPKPTTCIEQQLDPDGTKNLKPAISRAVKRYGTLARAQALFELAFFGDNGYPAVKWMNLWQGYRDELSKPMREAIKKMPQEISELILRDLPR